MAGMSSNTWYSITLAAFTDPSWTASTYSATPYITDIVASGVPTPVYCEFNFGAGSFARVHYLGGTCDIPNDAVTITATLTMDTSTFLSGETWYSVRWPVGGAWQWFSTTGGTVRQLVSTSSLAGFIS